MDHGDDESPVYIDKMKLDVDLGVMDENNLFKSYEESVVQA